MNCAFDRDIIDKMAQADLDNEIRLATEADDVAETQAEVLSSINIDELAKEEPKETGTYQARECGNCHNILWMFPLEAINQVFDSEGWVNCNCGAVVVGKLHTGHWTP